jgi:hypothetical protein
VTDLSFFAFLEAALHALACEQPLASEAFERHLAGLTLRLSVDGETRQLHFAGGRSVWSASDDGDSVGEIVRMTSSRRALVALLEARVSALDSILRDELCLQGAAASLARLNDALVCFVQGGARSPAVRRLLGRYLGNRPEGTPREVEQVPTAGAR